MIDFEHIDTLRQSVGDQFGAIVAQAMADFEGIAETLDAACARHDTVACARALHSLRGVALNLGLTELAARCARAEASAITGGRTAEDLGAIRLCLNRSCSALQEWIAQDAVPAALRVTNAPARADREARSPAPQQPPA